MPAWKESYVHLGRTSGPKGIRQSTDTCQMESAAQAHGLDAQKHPVTIRFELIVNEH